MAEGKTKSNDTKYQIIVSKEEWEGFLTNKLVVNALKSLAAMAVPVVALFAYFGIELNSKMSEAETAIKETKSFLQGSNKSLKDFELKNQSWEDSLNRVLKKYKDESDAAISLQEKYGNVYQSYVQRLFDTYLKNNETLVRQSVQVQIEKDKQMEVLEMFKTEAEEMRAIVEKVNTDFANKFDSIKKDNSKFKAEFEAGETLILSQKTPVQVSRIANVQIKYEDENRTDRVKHVTITDLQTQEGQEKPKVYLDLGPVFKNTKEYFKDNEFSIEVVLIESGNLWRRDYATFVVRKEKY